MNRFVHIVSILVIGIVFIQCDKEPTPRASSFETPLITGFELVDENNYTLGQIGFPNDNVHGIPCEEIQSTKKGIKDNPSADMLMVYPNPCKDMLSIHAYGGGLKYTIWIVKAIYAGGNLQSQLKIALGTNNIGENFNALGTSSIVVGGAPVYYRENIENNNLTINLTEFDPGCYRVYADICGNLLWYNFIKSDY